MRGNCPSRLALACIAVLCLPGCLANSALRRKTHEPLDPEIAEAEALAAQAEAEAIGDSGSANIPIETAAVDTAQVDDSTADVVTPRPAATPSTAAPAIRIQQPPHLDRGDSPKKIVIRTSPRPRKVSHAKVARDESVNFLRKARKPKSKKTESVFSAAMHGGGLDHWGKTVHAAVKSLAGNATKKATNVASPSEARVPSGPYHQRHISSPAKDIRKGDAASASMDHHSTVRKGVRAAVKEVLPGKKRRKALRKLPRNVTKHVGEAALRLPRKGLAASPDTRPIQGSKAPPGLTAADDEEAADFAMAAADEEQEERSDTHDFSQVEPGIAYGQGVPHTAAADQRALDEASRLEEEERARRVRELKEEETALPAGSSGKPSAAARQRRMLHEMEEIEEKITEETKSESLAYMLGGVKMDLYQLNEKMDMLQKDIDDGVPLEQPDIDENVIYPLSACMRCIFLLSAQYFTLYTAVAICKAFVDIFELEPGCAAERSLRAACDTVFYAPMLCVLFLGAHLRALQVTLGRKGPQEWAETAMQICAWSCLIQTLMVLALPFFTTKGVRGPQENSLAQIDLEQRDDVAGFAGFLTFLRYAALVGMYAGFIMVCVAVVLMDARSLGAKPSNIWDDPATAKTEYAPPVSAAMVCTIALTLFFFVIHLAHAALWSCRELLRGPSAIPHSPRAIGPRAIVASWEECLRSCASAVNLAPMLCTLFIAARMRALQMDPKKGRPQSWAEGCFYLCAGSVMTQTLLIILAKILGGRSIISPRQPAEELASTPRQRPLRTLVLCVSYFVMAVTYGACGVVMCSIFMIKAKAGGATPPLSPAMLCVMFLVVLYLLVFLCVFLAEALAEASDATDPARVQKLQRLLGTCKMAENTVKFGPMLAVIFVGARMRALQMSNQKGSPQCWAQDAMYMASGAVFLQLCAVVASGALSSSSEVDEDGMLVTKNVGYLPGRIFLEIVKAFTFFMLFGGVLAVVASVLIIRPETAQCAKRGFAE